MFKQPWFAFAALEKDLYELHARIRSHRGVLSREEWIAKNPGKRAPVHRIVHGTPITPARLLDQLKGGSFCVSHAYPAQLNRCIELVGAEEILILDNGAFTHWKQGKGQIVRHQFWEWANDAQWRSDVAVAVIPDVIMGNEEQNWLEAAYAIRDQFSEFPERTMFIWHLDDSIENLARAARQFNFVGLGSCAEYDVQKHPEKYLERLRRASVVFNYVEHEYGHRPFVHLMRGIGMLHRAIRFDSADSTNIARNHWRTKGQPNHVAAMAARIAAKVYAEQKWIGTAYPTSNFDDEAPILG
jgi:hypothetical protein